MSELRIRKLNGVATSLGQVNVPTGHTLQIGETGTIDCRNTGALQLPTEQQRRDLHLQQQVICVGTQQLHP